jgi:hypothetical protein
MYARPAAQTETVARPARALRTRPFVLQALRAATDEAQTAPTSASHNFGALRMSPAGGQPLPRALRAKMEGAFGQDFSAVRVHRDERAAAIGARAYTQGQHLHFAPGQYQPDSPSGQRVVAHELAHVAQQRAGRVPAPRGAGAPVNSNPALETEADRLGAQALSGARLGAQLRPAAATPAGPAHNANAPVQCLRTQDEFSQAVNERGGNLNNQHLQTMHQALANFHGSKPENFQSEQEYSDHRAKALDDMEHAAYRYYDTIKGQGATGGQHDLMLDMFDEMQQAHTDHVDYIHQNNLKIYAPDRGNLSHQEETQLDQDWNAVRNSSGLIQLPGGQENEASNRQVRAMNAKLLSRPHGRGLIHDLLAKGGHDDDRTITHEYLDRDDPETARKKRSLIDYRDNVVAPKLSELDQRLNHLSRTLGEKYVDHPDYIETETEHGKWQQRFANLHDVAVDEPALASEKSESQLYPGKGSNVKLLKGLRDSEQLSHDANRNLVPAPSFIVYGHELIHALHSKNQTRDVATESARYEQGGDLRHWRNREEHQTIALSVGNQVTENMLRQEHQITPREGHTGKARYDLQQEAAEARRRQEGEERWNTWKQRGKYALGGVLALGLGLGGYALYSKYAK